MDKPPPYCIEFKVDEVKNFSQLKINNSNKLVNIIYTWNPPFIYEFTDRICGPLSNIILQSSKQFGYK